MPDTTRSVGGVSIVLVGAGQRGSIYARLARAAGAEIVAIAEPRAERRERLANELGVPDPMRFEDWGDLAALGRIAAAAVVATPDSLHRGPAVAFLDAGYHVLLEKPMAPTEADARAIVAASARSGAHLAVAHVMRYQPLTRIVMGLLGDAGIGEIVAVQHLEPIGDWHYVHSYVRGNWRREDESSSLLLSKSCHDIDWLSYVIGSPAVRVSSFGGLYEFRPDRAPDRAGDRCLDCEVEPTCPFSAKRFYLGYLDRPDPWTWPLDVVTDRHSLEGLMAALETGPYGRCVYRSDNDVLDHQAVNIEYASGVVASFMLSAFTPMAERKTRIGGTRGHLDIAAGVVEVYRFLDGSVTTIDVATAAAGSAGTGTGHAGGDAGLIGAFVGALGSGDWSGITSDAHESLRTHQIVWAAEAARRTGSVVSLRADDDRVGA